MGCTQTHWLGNDEFLAEFNRKSAILHVPLSGSIDLTSQCNLRCVHCYLGDGPERRRPSAGEMKTDEVLSVIDEVADAGCLYFLLTGGEPLMREDFPEIYSRAKRRGLLVTVFTNGTVVTERMLDLFEELPPYIVEVSLYGGTAATYEGITRVPGSYERCVSGITRMLESGLNLRLKTVLMTLNCHELTAIEKMAGELGVKFRFDAAIFPRFDGDRYPLKLRVTPERAVDIEFSDRERAASWGKYYRRSSSMPASDRMYPCGAGTTGFHIDPCGNLQPCLMTTNQRYNLRDGGFSIGWKKMADFAGQRTTGKSFGCRICPTRHLCGFCPGFSLLENGREESRCEYLCAMGARRYELIRGMERKGGRDAA